MDSMCLFRSSVPADQRQAATLGEAAGESGMPGGRQGKGTLLHALVSSRSTSPPTSLFSLENPITLLDSA